MEHKDISYVVFESICSRLERTIKRLWILIILLTVFLVGSNCAWLYYESQFESGSMRGSYDMDGYSRRPMRGSYARGRYSGHGDVVPQLEDLMRNATDDRMRQKIQSILNMMD